MQHLWWLGVPFLFVLPGWLPAQLVTERRWSALTCAWSIFFSVMLLPPLCFGLAMLFGTVVSFPLALAVGALGAIAGGWYARRSPETGVA